MTGRKRPTIRDVAREAGVSIGTVSNVLNSAPGVRPETRATVERAIAALGYRPNTIARSLIARRARGLDRDDDPDSPALTTVGYLSVDFTARVEVLPHRDDRMTADGIEKSLGGPAANVAVMAAALDGPLSVAAELITALGDDPDSDWALAELAERNVDTVGIRGGPGQRLSRCMVLVEPGGSRTIVNEPFTLQVDDVAPYLGTIADGRRHCVHLDGYQVANLASTMPDLRARGLATSVHTTGLSGDWRDIEGFRRLRGLFDLVFLNRDVARDIVGPTATEMQLVDRVTRLVRDTASEWAGGLVVLTLGAAGAALYEGAAGPFLTEAPEVAVVDTTGAGDTFAGVFLAAWLNGTGTERAMNLAVTAASRSVTAAGAQGYRPSTAALSAALDSVDAAALREETAGTAERGRA
ncbi:MAG: PfkB family carbohydrate kinase [Azospirillaceae bacterium]